MRARRALAVTLLLGVTAASCGGGSGTSPTAEPGSSSPASTGASPTLPSLPAVRQKVATLDQPLGMAVRAGDPAVYLVTKTGRVWGLRAGRVELALDLSSQVSQGGEQGLLGLAFSPDGTFAYVNYTDLGGDTNVVEYRWSNGRADLSTRRVVLVVHQPFANHNGGDLAFGPDGYLYIGLGDGGSEGDPLGNGQSLSTLLGKMLRIDPRPSGSNPYGIPSDNPFVGRQGARPEIWAYGLRNPWRYSFDRQTGDLWIGDVGQNTWEEVDFQPAGSAGGQNYGWNRLEGTHPFHGAAPAHAVPPVYQYSHSGGGCVVTGGYVYRGSTMPNLRGWYVFADFCRGEIMALRMIGGRPVVLGLGVTVQQLASFGQDQQGELYALSLSGGVYRLEP